MMRFSIILLTIIGVNYGQTRIGDWKSYTSPLHVKSLIEHEDKIICATGGGLLVYDSQTHFFDTKTTIDDLLGTNLSAIAVDQFDNIWVGGDSPRGFVQFYDLNNSRSIDEFDYEITEIIEFALSDSLGYAIYKQNQDFGLIEYSLQEGIFFHRDLYPNWMPGVNNVSGIKIHGKSVFVGTDRGLVIGDLKSDPRTWGKPFQELEGNITAITLSGDRLVCVVDQNIYSLNTVTNSVQLIADFLPIVLNGIVELTGEYWGFNSNTLLAFDNVSVKSTITNSDNLFTKIITTNGGDILLGTSSGLARVDTDLYTLHYLRPNAPHSNQFTAIEVLSDGRVVAASTSGLAIFDQNGWRNIIFNTDSLIISIDYDYSQFAADSIPVDFGVFISDLEQGQDGLLYCAVHGTYPPPRRNGGGIIILDIDNPAEYALIDTSVLDYFLDDYMVISDLTWDRFGNLWVADAFATTKKNPIHVRNTEGEWNSFSADQANGALSLTPSSIAVDAWGRIWVAAFQDDAINEGYTNGGLAMLNYDGDPSSPATFNWRDISFNQSRTIWSLAMTPENRLYLLTPVGLTYYDLQFTNDNPVAFSSSRTFFPNISFGSNAKVKLDAQSNAWVTSTSGGIHVLLNNSTFWPDDDPNLAIESIVEENSPLLSNVVRDVSFDDSEGIVYIATNRGINSFKIPFADLRDNYSDLKIFPSPFHLPSTNPLIIDGLMPNSSVQILTVTGEVIKHIKSSSLGQHGYQVEWSGRDSNGQWVGSGVYLIAVYEPDGKNDFGKITVIKH
ncbi:hypothetical protein ACFL46_03515 [Candidatus Neomarinimicrobiota bacterium]